MQTLTEQIQLNRPTFTDLCNILFKAGYTPVKLVEKVKNDKGYYDDRIFGLEVPCDDVPTWYKLCNFLRDNKLENFPNMLDFYFHATYPHNHTSRFFVEPLGLPDSDKD